MKNEVGRTKEILQAELKKTKLKTNLELHIKDLKQKLKSKLENDIEVK